MVIFTVLGLFKEFVSRRAVAYSQPRNWGAKMFDFRQTTLFCLEKRLSKHKMTICSKNFGGAWPLWSPTSYAYVAVLFCWLRLSQNYWYFSIYQLLKSG